MKLLNLLKNNKIITSILSILIILFLYFFFNHEWFFLWAFERHQNTLSWFVRPLLLLPFCYFAYKKSINGILLVIFAIFTSMFWFSVPEVIDPKVIEFLNMEKLYLSNVLSLNNLLWFTWIIIYFYLLAQAFWHKSVKLWLGVVGIWVIWKIIWSIMMSPEWWIAIIPFAIWGFVVLLLWILLYKKYSKN